MSNKGDSIYGGAHEISMRLAEGECRLTALEKRVERLEREPRDVINLLDDPEPEQGEDEPETEYANVIDYAFYCSELKATIKRLEAKNEQLLEELRQIRK